MTLDVELRRLMRGQYPLPIAHAHKRSLVILHDDARKLKCLVRTAEVTIQLLALVMLAQLHRDLACQQAQDADRTSTVGDESTCRR